MSDFSTSRTATRPDPVDRLMDEAFRPAQAPADRLPWDSWTWRNPVGRLLSAGLGLGALALGAALGGLTTWTYWTAMLAPDVALFYDLANAGPEQGQLSPKAARLYNILHHPALPAAIVALGVGTFGQPLIVGGLAWFGHVAIDRSFGYGKRLPDGRRC